MLNLQEKYQAYLKVKSSHPEYSDESKYPTISISKFEKYADYLEDMTNYVSMGVFTFIFNDTKVKR